MGLKVCFLSWGLKLSKLAPFPIKIEVMCYQQWFFNMNIIEVVLSASYSKIKTILVPGK
jgi:hypothetical protein